MSENPYGAEYNRDVPTTHSGLGIASFILSLVGGFAGFALVVVAAVMVGEDSNALPDDDPGLIVLGLALIGCGCLILTSVILGIAAMFQADRKKLFAILGLIFSFLACVGFGGLMVLGSMA